MSIPRWIYRHFLNSVPAGIVLLVLIALYIALGSGFAGVREWLEMDELLFFNYWPFKILVGLLVINLLVVTIVRIPLTVPRYGVWAIHLGIILLLISLSAYYRLKVEGIVPLIKGTSTPASFFYDRWERALYVRTPYSTNMGVALEGLPRFAAYDESRGNADYLDQPTLRNLEPMVPMLEANSQRTQLATLADAIGVKDPVKIDIIGYYPYGEAERWVTDPAVKNVGLKITTAQGQPTWIIASEAADALIQVSNNAVVEHRHLPTAADVEIAANAAKRLHKLSMTVGDVKEEVFVEPGETYELGTTGYSVQIEGFTPQFMLSSGNERSDVLTTLISHKKPDGTVTQFRRTVLSAKDVQTDFELNVAGAGPFGKRKTDGVLDANIHLGYAFSDPTRVLPTMDSITAKYMLFTAEDAPGITMLRVSSREPSSINTVSTDTVDLKVLAPHGMFEASAHNHDHDHDAEAIMLNIKRFDHVKRSDAVTLVPGDQRNRDIAQAGAAQFVRVKVTCGDWSQTLAVSFDQFALHNQWPTPQIKIPGAETPFQLMLGNLRRPLPVQVRLDDFAAIPYAGGDVTLGSAMREFKSSITFLDPSTGRATQSSASFNEPAFFKRGGGGFFAPTESWIFSQASWNPENLDWTALQVGNRPFVRNQVFACALILGGLLYAFYLKPILISRMKARALREAELRNKTKRARPHETPSAQPV